jgi:hypothetical protein
MKNEVKKLLFLCCCLFFGVVYGQATGLLYQNSYVTGEKNIVRYASGANAFINASKKAFAMGYHFTLTNLTNMIDTYFQDDFEVRDMEIFDDKVFFCGQDMTTVSGFIGWFNISDLFYGGGDVHIDKSLSVYGLLSLDNIEVFTGQGGIIHIAGYGVHSIGTDPYNPFPYNFVYTTYRAFEAVGNPASGMQYRVADLYSGGYKSDIKDMVVTDDFVVYLECSRNMLCEPFIGIGIDLEVFPKYNMFSAAYFALGQFQTNTLHTDTYYWIDHVCTYLIPDNSDPHTSEAKMVHIGDNKVAVCSYRTDLDCTGWFPLVDCVGAPPNSYNNCVISSTVNSIHYYLANRIYDVSPVLTNNPMVMLSAEVVKLPGELDVIEDFVYNSSLKSYLVVHKHERVPGVGETAFTTMDYSSGMPANVVSDYEIAVSTIYFYGWNPTSVCQFGDDEYLISGNHYNSYEQMFWKSGFYYNEGNCDEHRQYPMAPISTMEAKYNTWDMNASNWALLDFADYLMESRVEKEVAKICD